MFHVGSWEAKSAYCSDKNGWVCKINDWVRCGIKKWIGTNDWGRWSKSDAMVADGSMDNRIKDRNGVNSGGRESENGIGKIGDSMSLRVRE